MSLVRYLAWNHDAESALGSTLGDDRNDIVAGVAQGRLELWNWNDGALWVVTCVSPPDLVICCVGGADLRNAGKMFAQLGRKTGLVRVRYYSSRGPAIQRLLKRDGWDVREVGRVYHIPLESMY